MQQNKFEKLKIEYDYTVKYIFYLGNTRFTLLGFLPFATGVAFSFSNPESNPINSLIIGILGLITSIGVLFYDQRNTEIYNDLIGRAKMLEAEMYLTKNEGTFQNRSKRIRRLFDRFEIWHDKGLAFIYSIVLWTWMFIVFAAVTRLLSFEYRNYLLELCVSTILAYIWYKEILRLDSQGKNH